METTLRVQGRGARSGHNERQMPQRSWGMGTAGAACDPFCASARPWTTVTLVREQCGRCHAMSGMRTARMNLRLDSEADERIRRAAKVSGENTSSFVQRAASAAADAALADRREFLLGPEEWKRFVAELDRLDSGAPELDDWLRRFARVADASGTARTYVRTEGKRVVGYYALTPGAVDRSELPARHAKGMPAHPIGVILLARLALDRSWQGQGYGRALVADAAIRTPSKPPSWSALARRWCTPAIQRQPRSTSGSGSVHRRPTLCTSWCLSRTSIARSATPEDHAPLLSASTGLRATGGRRPDREARPRAA